MGLWDYGIMGLWIIKKIYLHTYYSIYTIFLSYK
jgi:hypothetical protein